MGRATNEIVGDDSSAIMDEDLKTLVKALIEGQIRTDRSVNELALTVTRYVDAADARMKRLEENLDRGKSR